MNEQITKEEKFNALQFVMLITYSLEILPLAKLHLNHELVTINSFSETEIKAIPKTQIRVSFKNVFTSSSCYKLTIKSFFGENTYISGSQ